MAWQDVPSFTKKQVSALQDEAIAAGDRSRALAAMAEAEPVIIRAAQRNVVHRNAARRKVSRLAHRIAKLGKS